MFLIMFQICKYDPVRDISSVAQHGYIDIVRCFMNGEVPANVSEDDEPYNGIDNPSEVGANVTDVFEAMRAAKAMEHAAQVAGVDQSVSTETKAE